MEVEVESMHACQYRVLASQIYSESSWHFSGVHPLVRSCNLEARQSAGTRKLQKERQILARFISQY